MFILMRPNGERVIVRAQRRWRWATTLSIIAVVAALLLAGCAPRRFNLAPSPALTSVCDQPALERIRAMEAERRAGGRMNCGEPETIDVDYEWLVTNAAAICAKGEPERANQLAALASRGWRLGCLKGGAFEVDNADDTGGAAVSQ